jgi:hypothetical protein
MVMRDSTGGSIVEPIHYRDMNFQKVITPGTVGKLAYGRIVLYGLMSEEKGAEMFT